MDGSQAIAAGAALSAFSFGAQHGRLMRMEFPQEDGPDAILLPNRMTAQEEVSRCFRFDVELPSDDPRIPLKAMREHGDDLDDAGNGLTANDDGSFSYRLIRDEPDQERNLTIHARRFKIRLVPATNQSELQ